MSRWIWLLLVFALPLMAAEGLYDFDNEQQRERFHELSEPLRCPKCQNETIAESGAPISSDMRERVR